MTTKKVSVAALLPVLLCFFTMGFVDLVGIASNFVKQDLALTDAQANFIPSLLFVWFLIFSVPVGMLMNKIGRKKTVLIALLITCVSLLLPVFGKSYALMLCAFSLLGIGNAFLQVSLNPLLSSIVSGDKLASSMTFGQFFKAIASFLAPIIASLAATAAIPQFGLGWRVLFPIYMIVAVIAVVWLGSTSIKEPALEGKTSSFGECLSLLGKPVVLLSFIGILCHVGIDVGINTTAPKLLMERLSMTLEAAAYATTVYFISRTVASFVGAIVLSKMSIRNFFLISMCFMVLGFIGMIVGHSSVMLYTAIVLAGIGNANIFSLVISQAFLAMPEKQNEISSLMIMGLFGGTLFPMAMGFMSDNFGQNGAIAIMLLGAAYLIYYALRIKKA